MYERRGFFVISNARSNVLHSVWFPYGTISIIAIITYSRIVVAIARVFDHSNVSIGMVGRDRRDEGIAPASYHLAIPTKAIVTQGTPRRGIFVANNGSRNVVT